MAMNHFVAFSRRTTGAAIVAGAPYGCNEVEGPDDKCGAAPTSTDWDEILPKLRRRMRRREVEGLIDPIAHMWGSKVYLYSGKSDFAVARSVMDAVHEQLVELVGPDTMVRDFDVDSTHGWVVDGATCGPGSPGSLESWCAPCCCAPSSLLACEGEDLSGRLLRHLLSGELPWLRAPALTPLIEVSQASYVAAGRSLDDSGLWHTAYVYAPWRCRTEELWCKVHVHYHGCVWGAEYTGTDLIMRLGLAEWAEAGDIILLFPQASSTLDSAGCWDWQGASGQHFDTQYGAQLMAVQAMLQDLPSILSQAGNSSQPTLVV